MTKLDLSFSAGEKSIASATIKPLPFVTFAAFMTEARAMKNVPADIGIRRLRLMRQVAYSDASGAAVTLDESEIMRIPIVAARKLIDALDATVGTPGEIIGNGDGISGVITYKLGTAIPVAGSDKTPITELEFMATTYGEVEAMLVADDPVAQTIAMLQTIAKPIHKSLTSMPTWALNAISIADGVTIAQKVLPRFLEDNEQNT